MTRAIENNEDDLKPDSQVVDSRVVDSRVNLGTEAVRTAGGLPEKNPRAGTYRDTGRKFFSFPRELLSPAILIAVSTAGLFYWTFGRMWERWNNAHGYYSHGPLILPISIATAWLIVRHRGLPMNTSRGGRWVAISILLASILLHLASMYARVTFVSGFMLLPILGSVVLYLGGWKMLSRLWFPIAFLAFMIPLPDPAIGDINFRLKIFAAQAATGLVNLFGAPAYLRGAEIFLQGGRTLTVEDACSGLRSLISLLAFATLFTYACKLRGYKRWLLLLTAVPIAVAANVVRIVTLTLVANAGHVELATPGGWVHDGMGFVVFVIAFVLMFILEEIINLLPGAKSAQRLGFGT